MSSIFHLIRRNRKRLDDYAIGRSLLDSERLGNRRVRSTLDDQTGPASAAGLGTTADYAFASASGGFRRNPQPTYPKFSVRTWDGAVAEQVRAEWRLWVGNGRSSPEERGSANRTRAVGGVKSVSRFELQGKTHEASTYAQTGVNADGGTLDGPIGSRR